jgi:hypothetical protein
MRRGFILLFLLASVLWQSLTLGGQATPFGHPEDVGHALLHWQDSAHHHHDDGSFHEEDGSDAVAHVAADGALHASAILAAPLPLALVSRAAAPLEVAQRATPPPPLDGLRRPPRTLA